MLEVGEKMPEFKLRHRDGDMTNEDFAGQPAVIAFYAVAFTGG